MINSSMPNKDSLKDRVVRPNTTPSDPKKREINRAEILKYVERAGRTLPDGHISSQII
jgi:hypothetical protein